MSIKLIKVVILIVGVITLSERTVYANDRTNIPLGDFRIDVIKTHEPIKIDGVLDEDCWKQAQAMTGFTQWMPDQEKEATEKTICYITYDEHNLYFAAKCFETNQNKITANIDNRDAVLSDDWIMLLIDSYNDMQSAYEFLVNPLGIQADLIQYGDHDDTDWDAVWFSKGIKTHNGWQCEMAIPFTSIRFPPKNNQIWRFQIFRRIAHKSEMASYVPLRKIDNNALSRTAILTGINGIVLNQTLNVLPYFVARQEKQDLTQNEMNIGGDLKYALRSNIVLDLTANPDYGQIEADIDQINLTPYELYLQEKRPFFLEKTDVFETPFNLFYSRRISNPIFGLKTTGKFGKYGFGTLYSKNDNENNLNKEDFFVARVQRDIFSQSKVGIIITDKEEHEQYNRVIGTDWRIFKGSFTFKGQLARSWSKNTSRLAWIGRNTINFSKNNLQVTYYYKFAEKNFNTLAGYYTPLYADLTLQPISYRKNLLSVSYRFQINRGLIRNINSSVNYSMTNSYQDITLNKRIHANISAEFDANITTAISFTQKRQFWEDKQHDLYSYYFYVSGNPSKYFTAGIYYGEGKALDYWNATTVWQKDFSFSLELKPTPRIEISPSINYASQYSRRGGEKTFDQWVGLVQLAYNYSSDLFFKVFLQGNDLIERYTLNVLGGYTFLPGSTFYVAYNSDYLSTNGKHELGKQIFYTKVSILLGI